MIKTESGTNYCIDCYLTEMGTIQGYAICPYCENHKEL